MRRDVRLDPKSVEQTGGRPTTIAFTVSYRGRDPRVVADVTNTLASLSVDENARMRERQATGTALLLEREVDEMKKRLSEEERRLREFRIRHSGQLPPKIRQHLFDAGPLALILELNVKLALVQRIVAAADRPGHMRHVRRVREDVRHLALQFGHGIEGNVLPGNGRHRDLADVFLREEALRRDLDQPGGRRSGSDEDQED